MWVRFVAVVLLLVVTSAACSDDTATGTGDVAAIVISKQSGSIDGEALVWVSKASGTADGVSGTFEFRVFAFFETPFVKAWIPAKAVTAIWIIEHFIRDDDELFADVELDVSIDTETTFVSGHSMNAVHRVTDAPDGPLDDGSFTVTSPDELQPMPDIADTITIETVHRRADAGTIEITTTFATGDEVFATSEGVITFEANPDFELAKEYTTVAVLTMALEGDGQTGSFEVVSGG